MTIVASFSIDKHPVLIGDLLLSAFNDEKNYQPFNIPTCEDVNRLVPKILWRLVTGLQSKIILLNSQLALSWSGSEIAARTVLKELRHSIIEDEFTIQNIHDFLDSINDLGKQELYLTGMALQKLDNGTATARFAWDHEKKWNSTIYRSDVFGEVYAGGSGGDDLITTLKNIGTKPKASRDTNSAEQAILMTLSVLGHLQGQQMRKSQGLTSMYGGGYELITLLDGKLKKIDDITYHFWEVTSWTKDDFTIRFHNTLKYLYFDDYLSIRKVQLFKQGKKSELKDEIFILPSYLHELSDKDKEDIRNNVVPPDLNSKFSVVYLHIPNDKSSDDVISLVHYTGNQQAAVQYEFKDDHVEIILSEELVKRISSNIERVTTRKMD